MDFERVLALDIGTKRIGVALSDPLLITAQPLTVIQRVPENQAIDEITSLCKQYNINKVIVGLPKNMNGTIGPQAEDCTNFSKKIQENYELEIIFEDERLTSKQAESILAFQGKKYTKDKGLVDIASAAIILQQYLDKRRIK
jgi:putative Holliday junction resolvase